MAAMSQALGAGFDKEPDIAANVATRIANDAQFLANMSNGQKGVIQQMQEQLERYREREAMHQGVISEQRTRIETARQNYDRAYSMQRATLTETIAGLRKHVDAAEVQLDAKEAHIRTLTEQLAYARNGVPSQAGDVYSALLTKLGVTGWLDANNAIAHLQRKASAFDAMTVAAARFK